MTDIFSGDPSTGNQPNDAPVTAQNPLDSVLDTIKNDAGQRKYKDAQEALKALQHSQAYIPQLQKQIEDLTNERNQALELANSAKRLEDIVTQLSVVPQTQVDTPQPSGLDEQAVLALVQKQLSAVKSADARSANISSVESSLTRKFGDKAGAAVAAKAAELGTTPDSIKELAASNPKLVLALFEASAVQDPTLSTSTIRIEASRQQVPEIKRPDKSVLLGATTKDQVNFLEQCRQAIYAKHGITP